MLKLTILVAGILGLLVDCVRGDEGSPSVLSATNVTFQMNSNGAADKFKIEGERRAALREALDYAAKQREDRIRGVPLPPSQFPFPNFDGSSQQPMPTHLNFYEINDHYPNYLECTFDVDEKKYNQSDEPKWFKASLKQIRRSGPKAFPPIEWIAIIIDNRAEYKDASTSDQCLKVGAIFKASNVFDSACDLSQLIANADMDRHPFFIDPQRSKYIPMEQYRWLIVERHAATNHIAVVPNSSK